jgi:hypothetical protein
MITTPSPATLRKYGLSEADWRAIAKRQGHKCGACGRVPTTNRLNIDHEHRRGWKAMDPADRKRHVRGLLCWTCNTKQLARGATVAGLLGAAAYLKAYEKRRDSAN